MPDIGLGNDFMEMTPKAQAAEATIDKWDYIKLKSSSTVKEAAKRANRQPTERVAIFANHII